MQTERNYFRRMYKDVWITYFCWSNWNFTGARKASRENKSVVLRHGRTCSKRRLSDIANWQTRKWCSFTRFQVFARMIINYELQEVESVGDLSEVCSQILLTCMYLERVGRLDFLWSVSKLARSVTKWTQACGRRKSRLISCIYQVNELRQQCHVGNNAEHCRLGLFQDSDFCWRPWGLKIFLWGSLMYHWKPNICPHQLHMQEANISTLQCSAECQIISVDAGLRMNGLLALDFWDTVIEVLRSVNKTVKKNKPAQEDFCGTRIHFMNKSRLKTSPETRKREFEQLSDVDYVPTNTHGSQGKSQLYNFEDKEAVIKMILKGRSPTMRHVSRTHRVTLDRLLDRINLELKIQINYVDIKNQLADILTKGSFSFDEWNHLLLLFDIMSLSMLCCSHFNSFLCDPIGKQSSMSKRGQEATSSEGSPMAKPRPTVPAKPRPPIMVAQSPWREKNSSQNLGCSVNLGNDDEGQGEHDSLRRLVRAAIPRTEFQIMKYTNHQYMTKMLGITAGYSTFSMEILKTNV